MDKIEERAHYIEDKVSHRYRDLLHKDKEVKLMKDKYFLYDSEIGENIALEIKERNSKYLQEMIDYGILIDAQKYDKLLKVNKTVYIISVVDNYAYVHLVKKDNNYKRDNRERIKNNWTTELKETEAIYLPMSDVIYSFDVEY